MGYSREVYDRANGELARRRQAAEREADARRARVIEKQPAALECEKQMRESVGKVARAVLAGGNAEKTLAVIRAENEQAQKDLAACIAAAGEQGTDFSPVYTCPLCSDTGRVGNKPCTCLNELLARYACEALSASLKMSLSSFEEMDLSYYKDDVRAHMESILAFCRDYTAQFSTHNDSLLMSGPTGTGKTHTALAIARGVTEQGFAVVYGPVPSLLRKLEREHFGKAEGDTQETLLTCDLLVLDDLGTEMSTSFTNACLYDILNGRMLSGLPTIISTNLSAGELNDRYGAAITSRINGTFEPLMFAGEDIRQAKLERRLAGQL